MPSTVQGTEDSLVNQTQVLPLKNLESKARLCSGAGRHYRESLMVKMFRVGCLLWEKEGRPTIIRHPLCVRYYDGLLYTLLYLTLTTIQ